MSTSTGITPPNLSIPAMPAVTGGAENYANRMSAMTSLAQAGNGSLAGGGSRMKRKTTKMRHHNNGKKVKEGILVEKEQKIGIDNFSNGIYTIKVNNETQHSFRILKK